MRATFILAAAAGFAALPMLSGLAFAQTRVFVSGQGSDANPCSVAAPCRSFQQAHNTVVAGGEIVSLDAAGYGALAISKAVTVTAIGIEASITTNSTTPIGISINAGASDVVAIRGLTVISGFTSGVGLQISSAKSVAIRDTSVSGFPFDGISVSSTANLDVEFRDVTSNNNGTNGLDVQQAGNGKLTALVTDSSFTGNGEVGVNLSVANDTTGSLTGTLKVDAAANGGSGIIVTAGNGRVKPVVMVTGSKLVNNALSGLAGIGAVQVFVDRTQISGNAGAGWQANNGATVNSYTDNQVNGNFLNGLNGVTQISSE
jgi:hypothetical protein